MMMNGEMMQGSGWMMGGMMLIMLLVVVFLITGIAYFIRNSRGR
ncbi:hypothetical protein [Jannaschia sp. S6380]|nr:hypothetical protein [Jannaschia sp. S6380]